MGKLHDENGKEVFRYNVEITCSPKIVEYIAESEEECKDLFLENNSDLDENDIEVNKQEKE